MLAEFSQALSTCSIPATLVLGLGIFFRYRSNWHAPSTLRRVSMGVFVVSLICTGSTLGFRDHFSPMVFQTLTSMVGVTLLCIPWLVVMLFSAGDAAGHDGR